MNQGNQRPSYNEIKDYIRKLLQTIKDGSNKGPVESFNSLTREVFIKAYNRNLDEARRVYEIPNPKENPIGFRTVWVDVFLGCLNYYEQKLRKEGSFILETENATIINGISYNFNDALEYINELEKLSNEHDRQKNHDVLGPKVNIQSVTIGPMTEQIHKEDDTKSKESLFSTHSVDISPKEDASVLTNTKLTSTFPKGVYNISSVKHEEDIDPEYNMHAQTSFEHEPIVKESKKRPTSNKTSRKKVNYEKYRYLEKTRGTEPLVDNDLISQSDLEELKESSIIFVSGAISNKVESYFYENLEMLKNLHLPKVAFINGWATSTDKITKEAMKIIKMCEKNINSGVICYEVNNEVLRELEDNDKILDSVEAIKQMAEILHSEGYSPLICADLDVRQKINKLDSLNYPLLTRISSKDLDDVHENDDLVVMHSENKYDQFILTDNTKRYIASAINRNLNVVKTPSKAA